MASTFTPVANFASGLGKYDSSLVYTGAFSDASGIIGTSDLSLNTGSYLVNNNPNVVYQGTGNGFTVTGWFNPLGGEAVNATPIVDISTNSSYQIVVCCSGTSVAPCLSAAYNNVWITTQGTTGTLNLNAWNFFCYTVCCSGNLAVQNLYVNGISPSVSNPATATSTAATYDLSLQFLRTMVAYGITPFANSFVGKLDDFRFYNRVVTPMEYRVLYGYSYGKTGVAALIPTLGTVSMGTAYLSGAVPSQPFTFSSTGTFSYIQVSRTTGGITATFYVSAGSLTVTPGGTGYVWTDQSVLGATQYAYVFTPFVLGVPGAPSATYVSTMPTAFNVSIAYITYNSVAQYVYSAASNGILAGTSVTNGITYYNYAFLNTAAPYVINYSCYGTTRIYVLAVGGGGGGGSYGGGGGGAGGVVMNPFTLPAGSGTMTVTVGAGGNAGVNTNAPNPGNGNNTTITFSNNLIAGIIAWGGGAGGTSNGSSNGNAPGTGGSGGGHGGYGVTNGQINSTYNNFCNFGATSYLFGIGGGEGGGGGAGTTSYWGSVGGNGIQCFLPGISTFAPTGYSAFGTYYWGGGGGGSTNAQGGAVTVPMGNGGLGGGGAGGNTFTSTTTIPQGGGSALNAGGNGATIVTQTGITAGSGGANTGGGGGAAFYGTGGAGGSGIVVIAFPATPVATDVSAIMTPQQLLDASNIPVLSNTALSSSALASIKGGFSCKLINASYFGPTMTLRASTDACGNYTQNFYADVYGNLFTGYGNTGTSVQDWLNQQAATNSYVTKWYSQGMDICFNSATQYTLSTQPLYDVANQLINFGYNTTASLTGWTIGNASTSVSTTVSYLSTISSIQVISGGNGYPNYCYYNAGIALGVATKITLYVNTGSLCDFFFGCNSSGAGTALRIGGAGWDWGFFTTTNWTTFNAASINPTNIRPVPASTWCTVVISITAANVATFTVNGITNAASFSSVISGTYIGMNSDGASYYYTYFTNVIVTNSNGTWNSNTGGNTFFNLPNSALPGLPVGTTDTSYTFVVRHGNYSGGTGMALFSGGTNASSSQANAIILSYGSVGQYYIWWQGNDYGSSPTTAMAPNNVVSTTYASTGTTAFGTRALYAGGATSTTIVSATVTEIHKQVSTLNYIASGTFFNTSQFQMYNIFYFSTALSDTDRKLIEGTNTTNGAGTPYVASTAMTLPTGGHAVGFTAPPSGSVFTISNIAYSYPLAGTMVNGTSVSNSITYNVYSFTAVGGSYTLTYSLSTPSYIYVLAVGGGGGGGALYGGSSGGGGGGVVMNSVNLQSGSGTITITVGAGGTAGWGGYSQSSVGMALLPTVGNNTTVNFSPPNNASNIIAWGGGAGAYSSSITSGVSAPSSGGSGGGGTANGNGSGATTIYAGALPNNTYNNYGNQGGYTSVQYGHVSGGGGGAGTAGNRSNSQAYAGNGIQCFLPGINNFAPSGTAYGTYYWAGGGTGPNTYINAGLGGGGGGAYGAGGTGGLNPGQNGNVIANGYGGAGGPNTGGGGGGGYNNYCYGGAGGSGIVVIAFPQTAVTTNYQAVLTPVQIASGSYKDVMTMTNPTLGTLSGSAYGSAKGAFACRLVNYNYFGPIMTLRHSADLCGNSTINFYADVLGNFGTGYLGTGTSLLAWLQANNANTSYAYVTKWYSQSMDVCFNSATQYTLGSQPIFDWVNGVMNFGYTGLSGFPAPGTGLYFNLPTGALPYGDSSYSYTTTLGYSNMYTANSSTGATVLVGGSIYTKSAFTMSIGPNGVYGQEWFAGGVLSSAANSWTSTTSKATITAQYTSGGGTNNETFWINNITSTPSTSATASARTQDTCANAIGSMVNSAWAITNGPLNSQIYNLYINKTAIVNADRLLLEATPSTLTYSYPITGYIAPSGANISIGGITTQYSVASSTVLSGTSVTNGITYYNYAFLSTATPYQLSYTCAAATRMFVLAVGGGGSGGTNAGSGGGGGGVVMNPMTLPAGSGTMTITVGAGSVWPGYSTYNPGANGNNTTVFFSNPTLTSIVAWGGGGGVGGWTNQAVQNGFSGGSGGGGVSSGTIAFPGGLPMTTYNNFGNAGGNASTVTNSYQLPAGGGGAGTAGQTVYFTSGAGGGNGIQCFLPGISTFTPTGYALFGSYYWGGGGGASANQKVDNTTNISAGPGGLGGGGGGANVQTNSVTAAIGGGSAINSGGNGAISNGPAGSGGANTGGGGGGAWNSYGGNGGSGIVVLAFPTTIVASDVSAVLTPQQLLDASNIPVLSNPALSSSALSTIRGAFSCKLVNASYFGPTITLRHSQDACGNYTQNFYADVYGNLYTGYGNTGARVQDWLAQNAANTTYAYVTKWYSQGMDICFNSATQYVLGSQPIYDVALQLINFGYTGTANGSTAAPQTNCYLNLPIGALPYGDASYSYTTRHLNTTTSQAPLIGGGYGATNRMCVGIQINLTVGKYGQEWYGTIQSGIGTIAVNNVVSSTYVSGGATNSGAFYVNNGSANPWSPGTTRIQDPVSNSIGGAILTNWSGFSNSQLYNMFFFQTALVSVDRQLIEGTNTTNGAGTPYVASTAMTSPTGGHAVGFTAPPSGSVFTISNIAYSYPLAGTMVNGTSVSNNITYNVYSFTAVGGYYTLTYSLSTPSYIYVLAVGGGGSGGTNAGSGGGGGGVVMNPVSLTSSGTITITVGAGALGCAGGSPVTTGLVTGNNGVTGSNTTVNFNPNTLLNITAWGGGAGVAGAANAAAAGGNGGSGGGGVNNGTTSYTGGLPNNTYNNFGNAGSYSQSLSNVNGSAGGGGAGTMGGMNNLFGGSGIQCFLPGISTFTPSGTAYGTYCWGAGGGGAAAAGGLGGGGNSSNYNNNNGVLNTTSALNPGGGATGNSQTNSAGSGGVNTGSGGGSGWNNFSGGGGSGIVVIAFPQTAVTSCYQSVIPAAQVTANLYKDSWSTVSTVSQGSAKGAFACRLLNYNYFGPVMTLRYSTDVCGNYTANFYADVCGNLGTQYLGTGTSVANWLYNAGANTSYAYVTKWYNQGMDVCFNSATQYALGSQPIYDVANGVLNFGYQGVAYQGTSIGVIAPQNNCFLNLPNGALPMNNSAFTYTFRYDNAPSNTGNNGQAVISGGSNATNFDGCTLDINTTGQYMLNLLSTGYYLGTYIPTAAMSWRYVNTSFNIILNGGSVLTYGSATATRVQTAGNNVIGTCKTGQASTNYNPFNGQLYNLYIFNTNISDTDCIATQNTPYQYSIANTPTTYTLPCTLPPAGSNVTISSITYPLNLPSTLLSGTSVTNGITYYNYAFLGVGLSYAVNYTCTAATRIYVLAVGGGGSGSSSAGGGGGGGGVVMNPVTLPAGSGTITVTVGAGGASVLPNGLNGNNGNNTTVSFNANTAANIIAFGGGAGGAGGSPYLGNSGGSGGGAGSSGTLTLYNALPSNIYNNFGNIGASNFTLSVCGGGGGAGTSAPMSQQGGNGIQCFLPGIATFAPSGTAYSSYYWGGGGGPSFGSSNTGFYVNGGLGGGGGGSQSFLAAPSYNGNGGGSAINSGGNGSYALGGNGGANTGGGGGGYWWLGASSGVAGGSGAGGSGIVVLAFPQTAVATDVSAILSPLQLLDASNIPVLSNPALSSVALSSIKGGFSCKLINASYFGPTMTLRHSADLCGNYTQNFYADVYGNLYTGYGNTGISVYDWLNQNGVSVSATNVFLAMNTTGTIPTGWTNSGVTNNATAGNTGPCFQLTAATGMYGNAGINSFLNKVILFDIYITNMSCDPAIIFAANSSGAGTIFRLDGRGGGNYSGFATSSAWNTVSAPTGTNGLNYGSASTWYSIRISINSAGVATWATSTTGQNGTFTTQTPTGGYTITNNGPYMQFFGGDFANNAYIDNIQIIDNNAYAYVSKWYNQGMDICFNSATQYVLGSQPMYDVANQVINFGYTGTGGGVIAPQTNAYFNLPNGALPYNDASYTYIMKHWNYTQNIRGTFFSEGALNANHAFRTATTAAGSNDTYNNAYLSYYYAAGGTGVVTTNNTAVANNVLALTYYSNTSPINPRVQTLYINSSTVANTSVTITTAPTTNNTLQLIGLGNGNEYLNAQLYYFYVFNNVLPSSDIGVAITTPAVASTAMTLPAAGHSVGFTPPPSGSVFTISNIAYSYPLAGTMINGTSVSNNITYNVYSFTAVGGTYTLTYTLSTASYIYVLAVGGGGGGVGNAGSGGGAGGVVMNPVYLSSTASPTTITITLGAGGFGNTVLQSILGASNGGTTTVSFTGTPTPPTIYAYGGGAGGMYTTSGIAGGSSGGTGLTNTFTPPNTNNNNYANTAGLISGGGGGSYSGGGGGAGTMSATGAAGTNAASICAGGNGIQCFLPGISTFAPAGTAYGTYYWGGGGGGSTGNGNTYAGNGGLGGGGGASTQTATTTGGVGGGSALNPGGQGGIADGGGLRGPAGGGGANTGGGGGGSWNGYGGAGGSGIVIIAFPQTAVLSSAQAILTQNQIASGSYNDVMTMTNPTLGTLSPAAYGSAKGAFACRLVNYNYFGPIMTLRHSADLYGNSTVNFYADVFGNLGMGYLGTGTSVFNWLTINGANTTYAYVTKWYSQSMDICFNSAIQYTLGSQPIYDVDNGVINFGYTGTAGGSVAAPATGLNLNLPNGALPYGDASYSYTTTLGYTNLYTSGATSTYATIVGGGTASAKRAFSLEIINGTYTQEWFSFGGLSTPSNTYTSTTGKMVLTAQYVGGGGTNAETMWLNNTSSNPAVATTTLAAAQGVRTQDTCNNAIGANLGWGNGPFNGQMYNLYVFRNAIANSDRLIMETGPATTPFITPIYRVTPTVLSSTSLSVTWKGGVGVGVTYSYYVNNIQVFPSGSAGSVVFTGLPTPTASTTPIAFSWFVDICASNVLGTVHGTCTQGTPSLTFTGHTTKTTNGLYNLYVFTNTTGSITKNNGFSATLYVLAVGGGGSGGVNWGGGGGAGGFLESVCNLSSGSDTISINVGGGGQYVAAYDDSVVGNHGGDTTVTFTNNASNNMTAYGGGGGGRYAIGYASQNGGSGGGGGNYGNANPGSGVAGQGYGGGSVAGGGGGAASAGDTGSGGTGNGGSGKQVSSTTLGIYGSTYGNYYWAGGGGGQFGTTSNGGIGGGGGGNCFGGGAGTGGGSALNKGGNANVGTGSGNKAGDGGANTGGGGGGGTKNTSGSGSGGSGIVIVATLASNCIN